MSIMKSVIIDFDCNIGKWIVCESIGCNTFIIESFDWISDAVVFCQKNSFNWR